MANVGKAKVTVPRKKKVAGRDHMLAFITPNEAQLLNRRAGRPGTTVVTRKNKVPAFPPGAPGGGPTGTGGPGSAGVGSNGGDTGGDTGGDAAAHSAVGDEPSASDVVSSADAGLGETAGDPGAISGAADTGGNGTNGNGGTPPSQRVGAGPDAVGEAGSNTPTSTGGIGRAGLQSDKQQSRQARAAGNMPGGEIGLSNVAENVFSGLTEGEELSEDEEVGMAVTAVNQISPVPGVGVQDVMDATRVGGTAITSGIEAVTGAQAQGAQAADISQTPDRAGEGADGGPPNEQPRPTEGPNQPRRTGVPTRLTRRASDELPEPARQPARGGTILAGGLQGRTQVPEGRLSRTIATGG